MLMQSIFAPWFSRASGKTILAASGEEPNVGDLHFLKVLQESGKVAPAIDRQYPMEKLREALAYLETGHARAKVVITI